MGVERQFDRCRCAPDPLGKLLALSETPSWWKWGLLLLHENPTPALGFSGLAISPPIFLTPPASFLPARRSKRGICYGDVAGWAAGCLSVTRRYCIKMAKPILKLFRPSGSPIILVPSDPYADSLPNSNRKTLRVLKTKLLLHKRKLYLTYGTLLCLVTLIDL